MVISQLDTLKAEPGASAVELVSRQPVPQELARRIVASPLRGGPLSLLDDPDRARS
jgi:hypothetical protein